MAALKRELTERRRELEQHSAAAAALQQASLLKDHITHTMMGVSAWHAYTVCVVNVSLCVLQGVGRERAF